jgi:Uma2 family endonuclease
MAANTGTLTPDALLELLKPVSGKHYELSDGDLIVVGNSGALHELIKTTVFEILTEYRLRTRSGRAFAETQFALRPTARESRMQRGFPRSGCSKFHVVIERSR